MDDHHQDTPTANLRRILSDAHLESRIVDMVSARIQGATTAFSIVVFDVDNSAQIRALSIGHKIAVLEELLTFVRERAPQQAVVIGHGTRDDIIVLNEIADGADPADAALESAERIREAISGWRFGKTHGSPIALTVSGGVAIWPLTSESAFDLLLLADSACRVAKRDGKNRCALAPFGFDEIVDVKLAPIRLQALLQRSLVTGRPVQELLRAAIQLVLQRHSGLERFCHGVSVTTGMGVP